MKCCIHEITPQGKIVPICAFNNIPMYREDVSAYYLNRRYGGRRRKKDDHGIQQQASSYN